MKRSNSCSPLLGGEDNKRAKIETTKEIESHSCCHLLQFSDDVLLDIMKYLDNTDIVSMTL